jgi:hypothetical protein
MLVGDEYKRKTNDFISMAKITQEKVKSVDGDVDKLVEDILANSK